MNVKKHIVLKVMELQCLHFFVNISAQSGCLNLNNLFDVKRNTCIMILIEKAESEFLEIKISFL